MYYWFRADNILYFLPWLAAMLAWWVGGWLLARQLFCLEKDERLLVGFGLGTILYIWLVNLLGRWIIPQVAYPLCAILVLALGLLAAWRIGKRPWLDKEDLSIWRWLLVGLGLMLVFARFEQGLGIFDEPKNLSLISIIGAGDIPPSFYPEFLIQHKYHYGFHILGGSLMQMGNLYPWSAFDLSKAIFWAYAVLLAALLGKRYIAHKWGAFTTAFTLVFASGTRYLLLFFPKAFFIRADKMIELQGNSALMNMPFSQALLHGWVLDGGPVSPYIFAFLNGIMDPFILSHQGPNAFSLSIFFLLWLILTRLEWKQGYILLAVVLSTWALAWETSYALFIVGVVGAAILWYWSNRKIVNPQFKQIIYASFLSAPIVLFQGGTISEMLRSFLYGQIYTMDEMVDWYAASGSMILSVLGLGFLNGNPNTALAGGILSKLSTPFSLRFPPAILSSHLGELSLFSPITLIIALLELGPVIFFVFWITRWAIRRSKEGDWMLSVLIVSAWFGFLFPIFFKYEADRDISRITWQALLTWTIMLVFMVWDERVQWKSWMRKAAVVSLVLMTFGGLMLLGSQMTALTSTDLSYAMNDLDARISSQVWGKIPRHATVYGPLGRSTILTGHLTGALLGEEPYWVSEDWAHFEAAPDIYEMAAKGYDYVYLTSRWYKDLPELSRQTFEESCVQVMAKAADSSGENFREFLDIRACAP